MFSDVQSAQTSQVWNSYLENGQGEKLRNVLDVKYQLGLLAVTSGVPQRTLLPVAWPQHQSSSQHCFVCRLGAAIGFHLEDKLERKVCRVLSCSGAAVKA